MTQLLPFLLILMFVINRSVTNAMVLADFQQQALDQHNYRRQLHCTGLLTLNSTINNIAQTYAEYLAANNIFQHSGTLGLGENLWAISSSNSITFVNGSTPTDSWYSEISSYSFNSPGFSSSTGHFTQVVWHSTTQLGIGIAFTSNGHGAYVVGNYYPPGNVIGSFPANVLPLCSATTGTTTTTTTGTATTGTTTTRTTTIGTTTTRTTTTRTTTASNIAKITTTRKKRTTRKQRGMAIVESRSNASLVMMIMVVVSYVNFIS